MDQPSPPTFRLGLAMAGAVSAGAYTAGVIDFLVEALCAWEAARGDDPDRTARHRVVIQAMSGTSAGGMAAVLTAIALARGPGTTGLGGERCALPGLRDAAVRAPALLGPDGAALLGRGDLARGPVTSLLDGSLLDRVAAAQLTPLVAAPQPLPFLADPLHLFVTFSNLEGLPYALDFTAAGGVGAHLMRCHADRLHAAIQGLGAVPLTSPWLEAWGDPGLSLDAARIGRDAGWRLLVDTALATGAVPLGLPARRLSLPPGHFGARAFPLAQPAGALAAAPRWLAAPPTAVTAVDGALLNNEPFELARWTIMAEPGCANERSSALADRAVVLIDPLPEPLTVGADIAPASAPLLGVLLALLPALMNQTRFKPDELATAADVAVASRFLVAPMSAGAGGEAALASSGLGAFIGFLDEGFRAHDFALGRANCQAFLRDTLALDAQNPIVADAPSTRDGRRAVVPLYGAASTTLAVPGWPQVGRGVVDQVVMALGARADVILDKALAGIAAGRLARLAWGQLWRLERGRLLDQARALLLRELARRGLLAVRG